jgi:mevalonate kinase
MNENQRHLEALEVSCIEIERMCALALDAGAVGCKLTGGGGGGCVIALAPGREHAVQEAWQRGGFANFTTRVGEP